MGICTKNPVVPPRKERAQSRWVQHNSSTPPRGREMSQGSRPSYLDYAEDNDDVLNKSWDVESRHRLQENALKVQQYGESDGAEEVFRARVELGLHELTAALTSLR